MCSLKKSAKSVRQQQADTRIIVHLKNSLENGLSSILIRTVDTDVVVILIANVSTAKVVSLAERTRHYAWL